VTDPPSHTFTRADMEALLAYGQSLGFGHTFITASGSTVSFGMSEDTRILRLSVSDLMPTSLAIGWADNLYSDERRAGERAHSVSEAKTIILNFYNGQR
jgi:hypothetical protein